MTFSWKNIETYGGINIIILTETFYPFKFATTDHVQVRIMGFFETDFTSAEITEVL
jgi:hypothetical protein